MPTEIYRPQYKWSCVHWLYDAGHWYRRAIVVTSSTENEALAWAAGKFGGIYADQIIVRYTSTVSNGKISPKWREMETVR